MKKSLLLFFIIFYSLKIFAQNLFPDPGEVFRDDVVPKINIFINQDSLNAIVAPGNEESNHHYLADFVFDNGHIIDTVKNIGFRLRGNTSRYAAKKSFKISFNTYEPGRKWHGLEKLNINGEHNDPTVSRSKVCWDLMREMRVPASRSNHVELFFNNQYIGLFINVEHIDEEFVQLRFGNNDGNLFKCLWPADLNYKGDDPDLYKETPAGRRTYELKTNETADDYSDLAHFIDVLNNTPINDLPCELEKVFNVDTYLKAIVIDILTGNWDGPIFNKNNFYLYHNIETGQFEYIPFDLDNTLGIDWFGENWNTRDIYEWDRQNEFRPIYERLLEVPEYRNRYSFYMKRFLDEIYNTDYLFPYVEQIQNSIAPSIENDFLYPLDYGFNIDQFYDAFEMALPQHHQTPIGLKEFIEDRANSADQQLELNDISPIISRIENNLPTVLQDISITAKVEDDENVSAVSFCYIINGQPQICDPMHDDGQHADGAPNDGIYGFILNATGSTSTIEYFVRASDNNGNIAQQPFCGFNEILVGSSDVPLVVNEFMASNDNTIADSAGEYDDWLEIYSLSDVPIYLGNYFLSDNENIPNKWSMPDISIQPGEYLIFWADGDEAQGDMHTSFKLSAGGEFIGIFAGAADNFAMIDGHHFDQQTTDVSSARIPNGTGPFQPNVPTPGTFNDPVNSVFENGLNEIEIKISPNPFSDNLNIVAEHRIEKVEIFDLSGKLVFEKNTTNQTATQLNTAALHNGTYFLKIKMADELEATRKIILQR
ncbi:MAG: CotH kinase family protein [Bacteroidota bacterium]